MGKTNKENMAHYHLHAWLTAESQAKCSIHGIMANSQIVPQTIDSHP